MPIQCSRCGAPVVCDELCWGCLVQICGYNMGRNVCNYPNRSGHSRCSKKTCPRRNNLKMVKGATND